MVNTEQRIYDKENRLIKVKSQPHFLSELMLKFRLQGYVMLYSNGVLTKTPVYYSRSEFMNLSSKYGLNLVDNRE